VAVHNTAEWHRQVLDTQAPHSDKKAEANVQCMLRGWPVLRLLKVSSYQFTNTTGSI
jgi:hypothetical protein